MTAESPLTLQNLKARLPYMFPSSAWGFVFYRGWLSMTVRVCEEIDMLLGEEKQGFCWTQIKEKFGSARFYYAFRGSAGREAGAGTQAEPATAMKIASIVAAATDESLTAQEPFKPTDSGLPQRLQNVASLSWTIERPAAHSGH